ncbi:hypothetical protein DM02DRAFT_234262 [Periconia macrospinosa]|uniref:Uncharacterized protein n=1 Tax=Periconia macrospinosa TaxID=97972 RepID=A0A2V1EEH8_9PLEO|nr:hypothetical protein DM02DRAFT_234262 [Periconia macrospinosa]
MFCLVFLPVRELVTFSLSHCLLLHPNSAHAILPHLPPSENQNQKNPRLCARTYVPRWAVDHSTHRAAASSTPLTLCLDRVPDLS